MNGSYQKLSLDHFYDTTKPDATHENLGPEPNGQGVFYRSDHYNFAKIGIPVAFFTIGLHPDYHRPADSPAKIDYKEMQQLIKNMKSARDQGWGQMTPVLAPLPRYASLRMDRRKRLSHIGRLCEIALDARFGSHAGWVSEPRIQIQCEQYNRVNAGGNGDPNADTIDKFQRTRCVQLIRNQLAGRIRKVNDIVFVACDKFSICGKDRNDYGHDDQNADRSGHAHTSCQVCSGAGATE